MNIPILGTLVDVDLREAWHHEAHSFTPWLAEHLKSLSEVLGIPLELEGQEVPVETFSADILARNSLDDTLVLIENQLEGSDHTHLGQIMTYLAGLDAHTVVWVAADFREAHLSALKWLNEHTDDSFAFFAVKVKAVRIGDSPIAPMFEVLARPNNWERQLQAIAKETRQMSSRGQIRKEFWSYYLNRFPDHQQHGVAGGGSNRWHVFEDMGLVISIYFAVDRVGVFLRGLRGVTPQETYELLAPHAEQLAALTGKDVRGSDAAYRCVSYQEFDTSNRELWDEMSDWLYSTAQVYESALHEIFRNEG